jgi:hypothetical protein
MADKLTPEQWRDMKPPFVWMSIRNNDWTTMHFEILEKLLYSRTSGWWYSSNEGGNKYLYVFEHAADMVTFKILLTADPFDQDSGEITSCAAEYSK